MVPQIPPSWADVPAQILLSLGTAAYLFFYLLGISVQLLILRMQRKRFQLLCIAIGIVIGFAGSILSFIAISFIDETKIFKFVPKEILFLFLLGSEEPKFSFLIYTGFFMVYILKPLLVMLVLTLVFLYISRGKWKNPIIRGSFYFQAIICSGFIGICLNHLILEYLGPLCFPSVFELPSVN